MAEDDDGVLGGQGQEYEAHAGMLSEEDERMARLEQQLAIEQVTHPSQGTLWRGDSDSKTTNAVGLLLLVTCYSLSLVVSLFCSSCFSLRISSCLYSLPHVSLYVCLSISFHFSVSSLRISVLFSALSPSFFFSQHLDSSLSFLSLFPIYLSFLVVSYCFFCSLSLPLFNTPSIIRDPLFCCVSSLPNTRFYRIHSISHSKGLREKLGAPHTNGPVDPDVARPVDLDATRPVDLEAPLAPRADVS